MKPPSFATWLVQRLGVRESIVGDLIERYGLRPSRAWYWRQVALLVVIQLTERVRTHKALTISVALTASMGWVLFRLPAQFLHMALAAWVLLYVSGGLGIILLTLADSRHRQQSLFMPGIE